MARRLLAVALTAAALCACGDAIRVERAGTAAFDPERVPDALRPLVPLAEAWDLDDVDRADRIEALSHAERQSLVARIDPHLDAIDAWLDSFDPATMPEEASAFFWLRLAVEEMRYE